jgi:hypothetical protein
MVAAVAKANTAFFVSEASSSASLCDFARQMHIDLDHREATNVARPMSVVGQNQAYTCVILISGLPPRADIVR